MLILLKKKTWVSKSFQNFPNLNALSPAPKLFQIKSLSNPFFINCLIEADPHSSLDFLTL